MTADRGLDRLNGLPRGEAQGAMWQCCSCRAWAESIAGARPYARRADLFEDADRVWWGLSAADWLEAFRGHPRIGERSPVHGASESGALSGSGTLPDFSGRAARWSEQEQAGVRSDDEGLALELASANHAYEARFGHIFLMSAAGRSGSELLAALHARLDNDAETELRVAAEQQSRITRLRLEKMLDS